MQSIADEFGEDAVWIEKVKLATKPVVTLEALAERDPLTKVVVEVAQETAAVGELPAEVIEVLQLLPGDVRESLEQAWSGDGRAGIYDDACALILDRLMENGGEA